MTLDTIPIFDDQYPIIRYRGVFDWQGLYTLCRSWIEGNDYRFQEKRYKQKGDEVEMDLHGLRKIDEMHRFRVEIYFHIWELADVDIPQGTKTVKRNTGKFMITIKGFVEVDYTHKFVGSKFNETLGKWFMALRKREIDANYVFRLIHDLYRLHQDIKIFLNLAMDSNAYHNERTP